MRPGCVSLWTPGRRVLPLLPFLDDRHHAPCETALPLTVSGTLAWTCSCPRDARPRSRWPAERTRVSEETLPTTGVQTHARSCFHWVFKTSKGNGSLPPRSSLKTSSGRRLRSRTPSTRHVSPPAPGLGCVCTGARVSAPRTPRPLVRTPPRCFLLRGGPGASGRPVPEPPRTVLTRPPVETRGSARGGLQPLQK